MEHEGEGEIEKWAKFSLEVIITFYQASNDTWTNNKFNQVYCGIFEEM